MLMVRILHLQNVSNFIFYYESNLCFVQKLEQYNGL